MNRFVGKRVEIIGDHPWSGLKGEVVGVEKVHWGDLALLVRLENDHECFVFKPAHIRVL